eukprot:s1046_g7.t3
MEQHLHERVRCFQFAYWLSGSDLFQVFGALRSAELSGGASWATLAPFLADRAIAKKDEGIIETIESLGCGHWSSTQAGPWVWVSVDKPTSLFVDLGCATFGFNVFDVILIPKLWIGMCSTCRRRLNSFQV